MQRDWYIVLGPAKTGTTVVARTLLNGVMPDGFSMEPASRRELEALRGAKRVAVKIIFDTWRDQLGDLTTVCAGNEQAGVPTTICLIRDPRDELVSRLQFRLQFLRGASHDRRTTRILDQDFPEKGSRSRWRELARHGGGIVARLRRRFSAAAGTASILSTVR